MKTILMCLALMFAQKQTAPAPPPSDLKFTVRLDRTAVWVGDQFHYLIFMAAGCGRRIGRSIGRARTHNRHEEDQRNQLNAAQGAGNMPTEGRTGRLY